MKSQDNNTSPEYQENKQGEITITYPQANKTHTTSIQGREELQRNTSVEEIHQHIQLLHPDKT
jgi:hypothetical protein